MIDEKYNQEDPLECKMDGFDPMSIHFTIYEFVIPTFLVNLGLIENSLQCFFLQIVGKLGDLSSYLGR